MESTCQNIGRLRWGNHPCSSACAGSGLRFLHLSTSTWSNSSQFCARKDSPSVSTSWQSSMQAPSECPRSCCPVSLARTHMRDALCALQKHVCQVGMPVAHASLNRSSPCRLQLSARVRGGLHFSRLAGRMQLLLLVALAAQALPAGAHAPRSSGVLRATVNRLEAQAQVSLAGSYCTGAKVSFVAPKPPSMRALSHDGSVAVRRDCERSRRGMLR